MDLSTDLDEGPIGMMFMMLIVLVYYDHVMGHRFVFTWLHIWYKYAEPRVGNNALVSYTALCHT